MTVSLRWWLVATVTCATSAWGQPSEREPHIGYLYPAGGQRGTVVQIIAGGQFLRGVSEVCVTGDGAHASIIQHYPPVLNLDADQRQELQRRLRAVAEERLAELRGGGGALVRRLRGIFGRGRGPDRPRPDTEKTPTTQEAVEVPDHPLLRDLEKKSLRELLHIRSDIFNAKRRQPNAQIAESVLIEIAIDGNAKPGERELRLLTPLGLTNPMVFQVGVLPERSELEPNDPGVDTLLPPDPPLDLPVLLNGQIKPGDVDRYVFRARQGQELVLEVDARQLVPYLADAVPGWFQATLALYDAKGVEVAFADDYRFDPDPVLFYRVPENGEYALEIRDSIYRGREDFVYRIAVGEQPYITQVFPLGGPAGVKTVTSIDGVNLRSKQMQLDTEPGVLPIREAKSRGSRQASNSVTYAVDTLPECQEAEPNDTPKNAQRIDLPQIVNGRIGRPEDVDLFQFEGRAGDDVVAEVLGRRLLSPLDSLLRLTDAAGRVLAWNDDCEDPEAGLLTHHADSYLRTPLPADGVYYLRLVDAQRHGGEEYAYRLRTGPPRPDFAVRVTPSSVNVRAGSAALLCVHAVRKDAFAGDIELVLKDAPPGFVLSGGRIPAERDRIRMTLTAPRDALEQPVVLHIEGRAVIGGQILTRPVVPAEDLMQAFAYRHLVPSQELMVAVLGGRPAPPRELAGAVPVRGSATVRVKTPRRPVLRDVQLELLDPPAGITLEDVTVVPKGLAISLKADADVVVGLADNLIVEAFVERPGRSPGADGAKQKRRVSLGVVPAIPFEIVQP